MNLVENFNDKNFVFGTNLDDRDGLFAGLLSRFVLYSNAEIDDLVKALRAVKNDQYTDMSEMLTEMLPEYELINEIKKIEDVNELFGFAISAKTLDTGD